MYYNTSLVISGLSRNVHYKGMNTKHPDIALSRADTFIKVTILTLTYADMYFLYQSKLTLH